MPRLKNEVTGVVVNVSDETATRLGPGWESTEKPRAASKPRSKKADEKSE